MNNDKNKTKLDECDIDISIIIVTYNPILDSLMFTLKSILEQTGIKYEIIIADDGSKNDFFSEIDEYLESIHFKQYSLVKNSVNIGTVSNLLTGLKRASGRYVKTISPGDALLGENILREELDYLETNAYKWIFTDAIYYRLVNDQIDYVKVKAHPQHVRPYERKNFRECRWNYVVLDDIAMGATMLCLRELQLDYCKRIEGKVIYAEDNIFRMMMFDGILGGYYPRCGVLYEYGIGISTSPNLEWKAKLQCDWDETNKIMFAQNNKLDDFQISMIRAEKKKTGGFMMKAMIRGKITLGLKHRLKPRMTQTYF